MIPDPAVASRDVRDLDDEPNRSTLTVKVPRGFDLPRAVCSYGYFLLAPNRWDPSARALYRPLRTEHGRLVDTVITQGRDRDQKIRIGCDGRVSRAEAACLRAQVARMLRLDEDLRPWHRVHPVARRAGFGRLFRSPTLLEDIIKTMTGCNVSWPNTMRMNALLCERIGEGGFPTAEQLAWLAPSVLQARCKVGYRAQWISRFARGVVDGRLDLSAFENTQLATDELVAGLRGIYGIGPYAAANICQLLGRYDRLPIDTETCRHFRQIHGHSAAADSKHLRDRVEAHFVRFAPYQFLAYWFELWRSYQNHFGDARAWVAEIHGPGFTAANLNRKG